MSETSNWRIGEVVDGRYRVLQVHEQGGMGVVYRVRHLAWDIDLAVKCPRPELFQHVDERRRFVDEAETWVSLGLHPHVCHCYYVRVLDDVPRVFAEYVSGGSLQEWMTGGRRLYAGDPTDAQARILDIAIQTAWGLDHAHNRGLVHLDVKPANVLLDTEGEAPGAKITDFGLARVRPTTVAMSPDAPSGASVLVWGSWMTPLYASPEQAAGKPLGRRTDIYSFAVSVLQMCVGAVTWDAGPNAAAALTADGVIAIPPALRDLLARCLRRDPADRPGSMADVATELIGIYADVTGNAYPRAVPVEADVLGDGLNNRGVSLLDLGRDVDADETFARALAVDPQNARAIYNSGLARWRRGSVTDDKLIAELEANRVDIGDPWQIRLALAQIHLERGDVDAAGGLLADVVHEQPNEPEVAEARRKISAGEIVTAGAVAGWEVHWPLRPPSRDPWVEATYRLPDLVPVVLTPDGRFLLSGGWDGAVRLHDIRSGQCVRTLTGHRAPVHAVDITPDGRFAVSVCRAETVRFWDLTKRRHGHVLAAGPRQRSSARDDAPRSGDTVIRISDDGRLVLYTGPNGEFRVWDVHNRQTKLLDKGTPGGVVDVSRDGHRALSVRSRRLGQHREDTVLLWDLRSGQCEQELSPGHKPTVTALCFSPDGRYVATAGYDGIRVWDTSDGTCVCILPGKTVPGTLSLSADRRFLLSGSKYENAIRLWDVDSGRCLRTFPAHPGGTTVVRLDGRFALSAGQDRTVRRWQLPGDYRATPLLARPRPHVEVSLLGGRVDALVTDAEQAIEAGNFPAALDLLRQARAIDGHERAPRVMAAWWALGRRAVRTGLRAAWSSREWQVGELEAIDLSGDGRITVTSGRDGTIRLWDTESGSLLRTIDDHADAVRSVCLNADGRWLLSSSKDRTVRLWDVGTGECHQVLTVDTRFGPDDSMPVRFGVHGWHAVVAGPGNTIRLWDLRTGELTREVRTLYGAHITDVSVSDDSRLAAAVSTGQVTVWDLNRGEVVHHLRTGSTLTMRAAALSADGRRAVCGDFNDDLRVWNVRTGNVLEEFDDAPRGGFHTVRMTADGRFAVSSGYWSYPVIWDVHNGRCVRLLDGHEKGASKVAMTPDGRFVLTGHDGRLRLWELDWELAANNETAWDVGATPYLEAFLRWHGPEWTDKDVDVLLRRLRDVGYGWLSADGVRAQLDRMPAVRTNTPISLQ